MAVIGLKMPIFAQIATYSAGARPTYKDGKVISKAISAEVTINSSSVSLYADDAEDEHDESFINGAITFGMSYLDYQSEVLMFGSQMSSSGGATGEILDAADDTSPEGGFGYYRVHKKDGMKAYEGVWLLRTMFKKADESTETKGESIAFQTPSVAGTIMRVDGYQGGLWRERKMFTNETDCISWVKGKAGIANE